MQKPVLWDTLKRRTLAHLWQMSDHGSRFLMFERSLPFISFFVILSSLSLKAAHWHMALKMGRSPMNDSLHRHLTRQKRTITTGRLEGVWTAMRAHVPGDLISVLENLAQWVIGSRWLRLNEWACQIISISMGKSQPDGLIWHMLWSTPDLGQEGLIQKNDPQYPVIVFWNRLLVFYLANRCQLWSDREKVGTFGSAISGFQYFEKISDNLMIKALGKLLLHLNWVIFIRSLGVG